MKVEIEGGLVVPMDNETKKKMEEISMKICDVLFENERIISLGAVQYALGWVWCQRAGDFSLDDMVLLWKRYSEAIETLIKVHARGEYDGEEKPTVQ